jgi:hypothetical protein
MQLAVPDSTGQRSPSGWQPGMEQVHKAPGEASFYQTPPGTLIATGDNSAPHIGVLPTTLPIPLHTSLPVVSTSHALGPPQSHPSGLPSTSAAPPPADSSAPTSLITRKKYSGKVLSPEEWQQYYEKLNNQRSFAMANPGKGAWFWEHLEPQLVRGSDGVTLAVKLHCRCCGLILGASNPSRTAAEHLRSGACPNFQVCLPTPGYACCTCQHQFVLQKDGAPEPPRKKRVRVAVGMDGAHMAALDPETHDLVVDPGEACQPALVQLGIGWPTGGGCLVSAIEGSRTHIITRES